MIRFDLAVGAKVGRLTLVRRDGNDGAGPVWICLCECGTERRALASNLRHGRTKSCGCGQGTGEHSVTHGRSRDRIYHTWAQMRKRCSDPSHNRFDRYGGRGIKVCARWDASFEAFLADMGEQPTETHSIDRIDNDRGYEPGNCRWATPTEQANNTSASDKRTAFGETKTVALWARDHRCGVSVSALRNRLKNNWPMEQAITTPVLKYRARGFRGATK